MSVFAKATHVISGRTIAALGILITCILSVVLLGSEGAIAGLLFMPVLASMAMRQSDLRTVTASKILTNSSVLTSELDRSLGQIGHPSVAMLVEVDHFQRLQDNLEPGQMQSLLEFVMATISAHMTEKDQVFQIGSATFGVSVAPQGPFQLEAMLNTCTRIQHSLKDNGFFEGMPEDLRVSIGFASSNKLPVPTGPALLQAAQTALSEARRKGPGAVRSYSTTMESRKAAMRKGSRDALDAFERGEIVSYYQPQISLKDGSLSGFEALTRWHHPERGMLAPAEFLPILEEAGLMERLGETMIKHAFQALGHWDAEGTDVPRIGVNFSTRELRDPFLVDRVAMLLDAGNLNASRLVVEVLETVIANSGDDDVIGNLAALSDLGCGIDLDDFGTGYASITNIRRFSVERIKIDRTFVAGLDSDPEQRSMVSAILTMANRLGVRTLAEGVETKSELTTLADLGVHDAQGFTIARPMPLEETVDWVARNIGEEQAPVSFIRRAG